jgi:hypothetical protein
MVSEKVYEAFVESNNADSSAFPEEYENMALDWRFRKNLSIWLNRNRALEDFRPLIRKLLLLDTDMRTSAGRASGGRYPHAVRRYEECHVIRYFDGEGSTNWVTMNDYAFLLANYRKLDDVLFIWKTKTATMDSHMGLHQHFLVFCGINETKDFLVREGSAPALDALDWITGCDEAGDFVDLDRYIESTVRWFDLQDYVDDSDNA